MASTPVEGGFVAAAEVMAEVVRAEAAPAADGATAGPMRWNNNTSGFVLRRMAQLLSDGTRPKCLKDYNGDAVSPTQMYNHMRKWR